jgi:hypothetical protein
MARLRGSLSIGKTTVPKKAAAGGPKPAAKGKGKKATKAEETRKQKAIGFCSHMARLRGIFGEDWFRKTAKYCYSPIFTNG